MGITQRRMGDRSGWPEVCRAIATLVLVWAAARPSQAQAGEDLTVPNARQGYFVALGVHGVAMSSRDHDLGRLQTDFGPALTLRLGQMVTPWLGCGLLVDGGLATSGRWNQKFGGLLLDLQLVPWRALSLHASAGLGGVMARDTLGHVAGAKGTGGAYYGVGLAYDFFPFYVTGSGGLGITPVIQMRHLPGSGFNALLAWVGVDLVWWRGLDKQELELPPDAAFVH